MLKQIEEKSQNLTPVRKVAYLEGTNDTLGLIEKELTRLRRRTKHWQGVNMALSAINKLKN